MKIEPLSMTNTLATIYPTFEVVNQPITEADISLINFRITMTNQLLKGCIEMMEKDPYFWSKTDLADFKKYLTQNKAIVFDMQPYFSEGSRTMAILDNMKDNIRKIEQSLAKASAFNFDLARMEDRLNDTFHEVPKEVSNVAEFRSWLKGIAYGD